MRCTQKQFNERLNFLIEKGYKPVQQGVWYHFKDGSMNFYPTTCKWFDEESKDRGSFAELPDKLDDNKYYNLDKRYLPDWVLDPKRQEWLKTLFLDKD